MFTGLDGVMKVVFSLISNNIKHQVWHFVLQTVDICKVLKLLQSEVLLKQTWLSNTLPLGIVAPVHINKPREPAF